MGNLREKILVRFRATWLLSGKVLPGTYQIRHVNTTRVLHEECVVEDYLLNCTKHLMTGYVQ